MTGPRSFDDEKLSMMVEPLTIRIDRLKDNKKMPIPIPPPPSGEEFWTKDEIRNHLEQFLVTHWSGGGMYHISVTDSSEPGRITMSWQPFWSPSEYPERVPPPLADARSPDAPPAAPHIPYNPFPPAGARSMPPYTPPTPPPGYWPNPPLSYPMPAPPPVGSHQYSAWREEADRRKAEEELQRLRDERDRKDREARELAHKAELDRVSQANEQRFSRLEASINGLASALKEGAAPKGPSEAERRMETQIAELREQTRKAEERAEAARREAEADRREAQLREMIQAQALQAQKAHDQTQRQIELMQANFDKALAALTAQFASSANRTDPIFTVMQQQSMQFADTLKALAAENSRALERVQALVLNPKELIAMARDNAAGTEAAIERTTKLTSNVLEMQNRVFETALSVQPQGNGVVDTIREGIGSLQQFAERYVGGKSKEAVASAQAQAEIARAQVQAMEIQARAQNPAAFTPPAPQGLAGAPEAIPVGPVSTTAPEDQVPAAPRVERLWGRTDSEWFGPAEPDVLRLREGAQQFLQAFEPFKGTGKVPENLPGFKPDQAAHFINGAVMVAAQRGVTIPALAELLAQGEVTAFLGVLLPDADVEYREAVKEILESQGEDDEEEEDDDEQATEAAPVEPAKIEVAPQVAPPPASPTNNKPSNNARRR